MPEIKHQFTGGKMNKDVDERLVPKGEYRHAMNIQVSTSEGSEVGTIQNVLGNTHGCFQDQLSNGSFTVGSISDEKNDALYWLVSGQSYEPSDIGVGNVDWTELVHMSDSIWRYTPSDFFSDTQTNGGCEPVFVDKFAFSQINTSNENTDTLYDISPDAFNEIEIGWTVTGFSSDGTSSNTSIITSVGAPEYIEATPVSAPISSGVTAQLYIDPNVNPMVKTGESIWIPMINMNFAGSTAPPNWAQSLSNVVYIEGFTGNVNGLVNETITILTNNGATPQSFSILAASTFSISYTSGLGQNVTKVTLDNNLAESIPALDFPNSIAASAQPPFTSHFQGGKITATVTNSYIDTNEIATGEFIIPLNDLVVSAELVGTQIVYGNLLGTGEVYCVDSIDATNNSIILSDCATGTVLSGWQVGGFINGQIQSDGGFIWLPDTLTVQLGTNIDLSNGYESLVFSGPRTLNFNHNQLVTGINIIDDMLFWTDNHTEPKKINIPRSVKGTSSSGDFNTLLINENQDISEDSNVRAQEKHITVIKKGPAESLLMELSTGRDDGMYSGITNTSVDPLFNSGINQSSIISSSNPAVVIDYSSVVVGDTVKFEVETDINGSQDFQLQWAVGDTLLFREFNEDGTAPPVPLSNYTVRGVIIDWASNSFVSNTSLQDPTAPYGNMIPESMNGTAHVAIKVLGITHAPPQPSLDPPYSSSLLKFVVDLEQAEESIFPLKFPRFSYRYKYGDGEYSAFAPWTDVAFVPGNFQYDPKEGWNTGMINKLQSLKLKNFKSPSLPEDVVSIDILYKEETSPNVYLVDTIAKYDEIAVGSTSNSWTLNEYTLNSETVRATLPSNQLLRPWDNVPRSALAQEVTGNRIVYANYTQNYNINEVGSVNYRPNFKNRLDIWGESASGVPLKSIKSLRDYKLGVVFTDKYGRETPILTSESGGFRVNKKQAPDANRLVAGLNGGSPSSEFEYFKFYIKETSSEYYNLPMDRWYSAEDGNIWLAFPSSDRNKVDIDTTLLLKKADTTIDENLGKYKVLAIESEAPEFIKTRRLRIGTVKHDVNFYVIGTTPAVLFGNSTDELYNAPLVGDNTFSMDLDAGNFDATSMSDLEGVEQTLFIRFTRNGDTSGYYRVARITKDTSHYHVALEDLLSNDIDFIYDIPSSPTKIKDETRIQIFEDQVEESPKFDGRFFVKIANDGKIKLNITDPSGSVTYVPSGVSKKIFLLESDALLAHRAKNGMLVKNAPYSPEDGTPAVVGDSWITGTTPWYGNSWSSNKWNGNLHLNSHSGGANSNNFYGGGYNWRYLYARAAYFSTFSEADITANGYPEERSGVNKGNSSTGVWFIDRSTTKYRAPSGDTLKWPDNNNMDWASPQMNHYDDCGNIGVTGGCHDATNGDSGISHHGFYSNNNAKSVVRLGFGGIRGLNSGWSGSTSGGVGNFYNTNSSFWGIGTTNSNHNDAPTVGFVSSLGPGFSFKWREDPTETIYTISGHTDIEQRVRFERHADGFYNEKLDFIKSPSSYNKNWEFEVTPKMDLWDPAGPEGAMEAGKKIGSTTHTMSSETFGTNVISVADTSIIIPGMTVYGSGISLSTVVVTVNDVTNEVIVNNTATNSTTADRDFGFTIRTVDSSSDTLTQHPWIRVDSIDGECSYHGKRYELEIGMQLLSWNLDSTAIEADGYADLIIRDIIPEPLTNTFLIELTGYTQSYQPNVAVGCGGFGDTACAANNAPVAGERMLFQQVTMNGVSDHLQKNVYAYQDIWTTDPYSRHGGIGAVGYTMEFMEPVEVYSNGGVIPQNPYVWETEPKEDQGLDVYYEISDNNPITLKATNISTVMPIGSVVTQENGEGWPLGADVTIVGNDGVNTIKVSQFACVAQDGANPLGCTDSNGVLTLKLDVGSKVKIKRPSGIEFEVKISGIVPTPTPNSPHISKEFTIIDLYNADYWLDWYNCYSFGNGVESNRIRDNFNLPYISNGVKVSTTLEQEYKEEHREYGLIYSGIYNSTSGVNNLNQFIAAEKITKDINPTHGSIQKLHSRSTADGDLIALCEDRVLKILANKDAVYNADGNPQLTATDRVLGQAIPFTGDFGISKNPESFASESYRVYFTDKVRGAVMRLSKDGLTAISNHGMKDWFRDNLKLNQKIVGSYDAKKDEYNVSLSSTNDPKLSGGATVSFREDVRGWVSFKSFVTENGISCANEYYTFSGGELWKHHVEKFNGQGVENGRNNFYTNYEKSSFSVILNDVPGSVKSFNTLNYEGSESRIVANLMDGEYYNLTGRKGWFVKNITTDLESGSLNEFIEKEGKWFNYIKGRDIKTASGSGVVKNNNNSPFDQASFAIQGLGRLSSTLPPQQVPIPGCTDELAFNYSEDADSDNGTCIAILYGCLVPGADNYYVASNTDDGSCLWYGCTDDSSFNYIPFPSEATNYLPGGNAIADDGSCVAVVNGCTDDQAFNYDPTANTDDGSCIDVVNGCMLPSADNINPNANTDDGTECLWLGCTEPLATNFVGFSGDASSYPVGATFGIQDDGSCIGGGCMDPLAYNFDLDATYSSGDCGYCSWESLTLPNYDGVPFSVTILDEGPNGGGGQIALAYNVFGPNQPSTWTYKLTNLGNGAVITSYVTGVGLGGITSFSNSVLFTNVPVGSYRATVYASGAASSCGWEDPTTYEVNDNVVPVFGCMDALACNYNDLANVDNNLCEFTSCVGCMDASAVNPNYQANDPTSPCYLNGSFMVGDCTSDCSGVIGGGNTSCCDYIGCTDSTMYNYDASATIDSGDCVSIINGCMTQGNPNYNALANVHVQSMCAVVINGCMDSLACNYEQSATVSDGNCYYPPSDFSIGVPNGPQYNASGATSANVLASETVFHQILGFPASDNDIALRVDIANTTFNTVPAGLSTMANYVYQAGDRMVVRLFKRNPSDTDWVLKDTRNVDMNYFINNVTALKHPWGMSGDSNAGGDNYVFNPYDSAGQLQRYKVMIKQEIGGTVLQGCTDRNQEFDFTIAGCMSQPNAVAGCMDQAAINYNCANGNSPNPPYPCTDSVTCPDNSCNYPFVPTYDCINSGPPNFSDNCLSSPPWNPGPYVNDSTCGGGCSGGAS